MDDKLAHDTARFIAEAKRRAERRTAPPPSAKAGTDARGRRALRGTDSVSRASRCFPATTRQRSAALAAATLTDSDRTWLESWCVALARHDALPVGQMAATCFGHIARRFRCLDQASLDVLDELIDPVLTYAQDALEDGLSWSR